MKSRFLNRYAFTLAEVLITLGVIGVVAAITLPRLIDNITERANSERHANIAQKITQAMEQMRAQGELTKFSSTEEFANVLQKYLKVAKRCNAENIADCWPTKKVINNDGEEFEVSKAKQGRHLGYKNNFDNNVGLVLADGSSIIMTYNTDNEGFSIDDPISRSTKNLPVGNGKNKEFPYTSNVTGGLDFVTDVNGTKGPNSETVNNKDHDIRSFRNAHFGQGCLVKVPDIGCVVDLGLSYSYLDCHNSNYAKYCGNYPSTQTRTDYWAGAQKACDDLGMKIINGDDFLKIVKNKDKYPNFPTSGMYWVEGEFEASYPQYNANNWVFNNIHSYGGRVQGNLKDLSDRKAMCVE